MSDAKHTPGPWKVMDSTYGFGTELGVCEVETEYCVAGIVADIPELEGQANANARLIAAAPEMLEALQAIADHTNPDDAESYRADDREGCLDTVQAIARAAIAKATGATA